MTISQNFGAFSEYMNFTSDFFLGGGSVFGGGGASNPQQGNNIYGLFYHFLLHILTRIVIRFLYCEEKILVAKVS